MLAKLLAGSPNNVSYENIQEILQTRPSNVYIINTLKTDKQHYLISSTLEVNKEEKLINNLLKKYRKDTVIIIYGENAYDETIFNKYYQLNSLGFTNCFIYMGGLFEWFLLQDVYGPQSFPSISTPINGCLEFKPTKNLTIPVHV